MSKIKSSNLPKVKAHRTVKPLPFVGSVGAKKSAKGTPAKEPGKIKRKMSLSKFPESKDTHSSEHQMSNYLPYEQEKGAGTREKGK
jgi:hypothetical protein